MIYSLKGMVSHIEPNIAIIECSSIGFKCNISDNTAVKLKVGEISYLYIYMNVKSDGIDLFGFLSQDELKCFKTLIGISGVGPKAAISILSQFTPQSLSIAVSGGDYKVITKCQGIGQKTAQRIILELKGKLDFNSYMLSENKSNFVNDNINFNEALEALKSLGYLESEILNIIKKYDHSLKTEDIIKKALKEL